MSNQHPTAGDFILRALHASEIAESCPDPDLREAFVTLSRTWLDQAAGSGTTDPTASDPSPHASVPSPLAGEGPEGVG